MNRITSIMAMHARDRGTWLVIPASILGAGFIIVWLLTFVLDALFGGQTPVYTGALATFFFLMVVTGIGAIIRVFPFAVGFSARRSDFVLGTLAMGVAASAAWAILLGLLSLVEANLIKNWVVGLHYFHLPFLSDGSHLQQFCWSYYHNMACAQSDPNYVHGGWSLGQFWVYFVLLLFIYLLGLLLGSIYQRFGRVGEYVLSGMVFLLASVFLLLSSYLSWWGVIFGWLAQQTAAALIWWLVPLIAVFALASYGLLSKATV